MTDFGPAQARYRVGAQALAADDKEAAAQHFASAVELDPTMADAWLGLVATNTRSDEALERAYEGRARLGVTQTATGQTVRALCDAGYYLGLWAQNRFGVILVWAARLAVLERFEEAWAVIKELDSEDLALNNTYQKLVVEAGIAYREGDLNRAIDLGAEGGRSDDPFVSAEGHILAGWSAGRTRQLDLAIAHAVEAEVLTASRGAADAYSIHALALRAKGDLPGSMTLFQKAADLDPKNNAANKGLADPAYRFYYTVPKPRVTVPEPTRKVLVSDGPDADETAEEQRVGNDEPVVETPRESVEDILVELDGWIGLGSVQRQVRVLLAQVRANLARSQSGLTSGRLTEHMVFTGPPGTGKTSIARIIARLYHALGVLDHPTVIEATRSDLVGQHLGATAIKTTDLVNRALGGVLFVDEAYSL